MKNYKLTIIDKMVTLFNEEHQDWSGETFTIDVENVFSTDFETEKLSIENIVKAVNDCVGLQLETEDLFFENGQQGEFAIIENGEGIEDKKGKFLADYSFTIEPTSEPLNLEKLFNPGY